MVAYALGTAFTLWMAVECVRRGQANPWLFVILVFPALGAAVYFLAEILGPRAFLSRGPRRASNREISRLQSETRRLDNCEAWTDYAQALRSRKRLSEALEAAEKATARDAESIRAFYELGLSQMGCGKHAEAARSLARVVERDPGHDSGEARYALAMAYEGSGDKEAARGTLESLARTTNNRQKPRNRTNRVNKKRTKNGDVAISPVVLGRLGGGQGVGCTGPSTPGRVAGALALVGMRDARGSKSIDPE